MLTIKINNLLKHCVCDRLEWFDKKINISIMYLHYVSMCITCSYLKLLSVFSTGTQNKCIRVCFGVI